MRPIKEQLESLRSFFRGPDKPESPKSKKRQKKEKKAKERVTCPQCQAKLNPKNLEKHKRRVHGDKKKKGGRKASIFGRRTAEPLSPERREGRNRLQRRGFDEGAKVPGSKYRKTGR